MSFFLFFGIFSDADEKPSSQVKWTETRDWKDSRISIASISTSAFHTSQDEALLRSSYSL
jgi:hypothetical protein